MDELSAVRKCKNALKKKIKILMEFVLNILNDENSFGSENNNIELILKNSSYEFKKIRCFF